MKWRRRRSLSWKILRSFPIVFSPDSWKNQVTSWMKHSTYSDFSPFCEIWAETPPLFHESDLAAWIWVALFSFHAASAFNFPFSNALFVDTGSSLAPVIRPLTPPLRTTRPKLRIWAVSKTTSYACRFILWISWTSIPVCVMLLLWLSAFGTWTGWLKQILTENGALTIHIPYCLLWKRLSFFIDCFAVSEALN